LSFKSFALILARQRPFRQTNCFRYSVTR